MDARELDHEMMQQNTSPPGGGEADGRAWAHPGAQGRCHASKLDVRLGVRGRYRALGAEPSTAVGATFGQPPR